MPTYNVTDPQTGKRVKLTGDSPPTPEELEEIFGQTTRGAGSSTPAPVPAPSPDSAPSAGITSLGTLGSVGLGAGKFVGGGVVDAADLVNKLSALANPAAAMGFPGQGGISDMLMPGALDQAGGAMAASNTAEMVGKVGMGAGTALASGGLSALRSGLGAVRTGAGGAVRMIAPTVMKWATGGAVPAGLTRGLIAAAGGGGKAAVSGLGEAAAPIAATAGEAAASKATLEGARAANAGLQFAAREAAKRAEAVAAKVAAARAKGAVPGHGFVPKGLAQEAEQAEAAVGFLRANTQASSTVGGIQLPSVNVVEKVRRVAAEPVKQAARAAAPKAATKSKEELMNELGALLMKGKP